MSIKKEYGGLDYFKLIAAFLVVAVHTSPLASVDGTADFILTRIIARIAVPFFFMVTGYFLLSPYLNSTKSDQKDLKNFIIKTSSLYGAAILLYIPLNIYAGYFSSNGLIPKLIKDIIFNGTLYHLWYLPASILGVVIVYLFSRKWKTGPIWAIVIILYLIGLLGDSYYGIASQVPMIKASYDVLFNLFDYTRNGFFFTPIFLVMGAMIANQKYKSKMSTDVIGLSIFMALLLVEGLVLHNFNVQRHDSMYLFLVPSMYFLFRMLLNVEANSHKHLRTIPLLIYIIHPMGIVFVRGIAKVFKIEVMLIDNSIIHYLAVCLVSVIAALLIVNLKNRLKKTPVNTKGRAWVEIDLNNLGHNVKVLQDIMQPNCNLMAVVKANGYGHGSVEISKELQQLGVKAFAVATISEAIYLRKKGVRGELLILGYTHPQDFQDLVKYHLTQTVIDWNYAQAINQYGKEIMVHIKIDTGMHRLGERYDNLPKIEKIFQSEYLAVKGMFTHLCVSDSLRQVDVDFSRIQIERFFETVEQIDSLGYNPGKVHIQSSYGLLNYPELKCDYARIGIMLYGALSQEGDETIVSAPLQPVLAVKARIAMVKKIAAGEGVGYGRVFTAPEDMTIAIISIGYADGIPRNLSETKSYVLVKSKRAPIIGRICMDQMFIDISDIAHVKPHDIVTVIGKDGDEKISCEEVAKASGTITNELLSRLGSRLEHVCIG